MIDILYVPLAEEKIKLNNRKRKRVTDKIIAKRILKNIVKEERHEGDDEKKVNI